MRIDRIFVIVLSCLVGGLACQSSEFNWRTFRFEQVGPRNRPLITAETEDDVDMGQIPPPAQKSAPNLKPSRQSALEKGELFRLYLGDESAQPMVPSEDFYLVRNAPLDKLAELLVLLYPGEGPGGNPNKRIVIYKNEQVWEQARTFAPRLDAAAEIVGGESSDWAQALSLLYRSEYPRKLDATTRDKVISLFNQVIEDTSEDAGVRWAAVVLSSMLHVRFEPRDYSAAEAVLGEGENFIRGTDYRAMVMRYHHLRLLLARGQKLTARKQAMDAMNYFQNWQNTDCYDLIRMIGQETAK